MSRLMLCLLLLTSEAHAGLIWQFTFGPDATNTIERGTLLLQLSPIHDAYDIVHLVNHFALSVDGQHYAESEEAPGFTQQWVDNNGATFDPFTQQLMDSGTFTGWEGTNVYLNLSDDSPFNLSLSDFYGVPWSNNVSLGSGTGIVTSWRVLGVPEPGTLALLAGGFLALVLVRRRDRDEP